MAHLYVRWRTALSAAKGIFLRGIHFLSAKAWLAIEPKLLSLPLVKCGRGDPAIAIQFDESKWSGLKGACPIIDYLQEE